MMVLKEVRGDYEVEVIDSASEAGISIESELHGRGFPLPLQQQGIWPSETDGERALLVVLRDSRGTAVAAVGVRLFKSRSLPGHYIARVLKFGHGVDLRILPNLVDAAAQAAKAIPKVLRLHLEVFSPDAELRATVTNAALSSGFKRSELVRSYARTLIVDLSGGEDEVLARFHRMVRKNLRKTERLGHVVAPIADPAFSNRLNDLVQQTMSRTGASSLRSDWSARIDGAVRYPQSYRISGLFLNGVVDAEHLVSFRWCGMQSGFGDDLVAASARLGAEHASTPLMHSVMWDMLSWARRCGAEWFDFGGVVSEGDEHYEQLRSISEFKRLFSSNVAEVGADFELEVSPVASRMAGLVSSIGNWTR